MQYAKLNAMKLASYLIPYYAFCLETWALGGPVCVCVLGGRDWMKREKDSGKHSDLVCAVLGGPATTPESHSDETRLSFQL